MLKKRIISMLLLISMMIPFSFATEMPKEGMRGVWIATVYNIDYPSKSTLTTEQLKAEADEILNNVAEMGLNTVFFQVRPSADALYQSDIFPWSRYLTATAGTAPTDGFDPLAYWIEGAHKRGLQLHAWINPYRITKEGKTEFDALPETSPAKQHPEWVVEHDGNFYFNPGLPSVRSLVLDGACEILENYDVDGIHLDDYFYPGTSFNDTATYERYGSKFDKIEDWRRDNVNALIASLDKKLHEIDPKTSFGVSPSGIWDNKSSNPLGSQTNGFSAYSEIYCDSLEWIKQGTVDYICPQIYWSIGYSVADFSVLLDWWQNAVSKSDVALYIGMGAYRMAEASPGTTWHGTAELNRQLALIDESIDVQGEVYYNYSSLMQVTGAFDLMKEHYAAEEKEEITIPATPEEVSVTFFETFTKFIIATFY